MYLDTSAIVPLYLPEEDSERCEAIASGGAGLVSSELLLGEFAGALFVKERNGLITARQHAEILARFDAHLADGTIQCVPLNGLLVHEAVQVMRRVFPHVLLRTLDALHLATYLGVDAGALFTRDKRMREAARLLDIPLA